MSTTPELTIHRVTRVKMIISEPQQCEASPLYRTGKMIIESEGKEAMEIVLFSDTDEMHEVYPFVELERPTNPGDTPSEDS